VQSTNTPKRIVYAHVTEKPIHKPLQLNRTDSVPTACSRAKSARTCLAVAMGVYSTGWPKISCQ